MDTRIEKEVNTAKELAREAIRIYDDAENESYWLGYVDGLKVAESILSEKNAEK